MISVHLWPAHANLRGLLTIAAIVFPAVAKWLRDLIGALKDVAPPKTAMIDQSVNETKNILDLEDEIKYKNPTIVGRIKTNMSLASLHFYRGDLRESLLNYESAYEAAISIGDGTASAKAKLGVANIEVASGLNEQAIDTINIATKHSDLPVIVVISRLRLGIALRRLGRHGYARDNLENSLSFWRDTNNNIYLSETMIALGDLEMSCDNYQGARSYYSSSIEYLERDALDNNRASVLFHRVQAQCGLARASIVLGYYDSAETHLDIAKNILSITANHFGNEMYYQLLGRLHHKQDQIESAVRCFEKSLIFSSITDNRFRRAETLCFLADLTMEQGQHSLALAMAKAATRDALDVKAQSKLARIYSLLGHITARHHFITQSAHYFNNSLLYAVQSGRASVKRAQEEIKKALIEFDQHDSESSRQFLIDLINLWGSQVVDGVSADEYYKSKESSLANTIVESPLAFLTNLSEHNRT